jgi:4-hydroxythreonine-4-phosphate dehydrogenase
MMFDRDAPPPLALTMGDPAGVGPELTLRAWLARDTAPAPFFALADPRALSALARRLALDVPILEVAPGEARGAFVRALPVVPLGARADAKAGAPDPAYAAAVLESIERAAGYVKSGEARALVTNPIAKATLYAAGFKFPGHTEFLGALAERHWGGPSPWRWPARRAAWSPPRSPRRRSMKRGSNSPATPNSSAI